MGWASASSSLRHHIHGAAGGLRFERSLQGRDHAYTHTDAECHPNSNASADADPVPHTDAHAVSVAKPIANPNAYAVRDQPFHLRPPRIRGGGIQAGVIDTDGTISPVA